MGSADLRPITYLDGYLPIEDHGLIGDGSTAALVGRDGAISWLCLPRFDSDAVFAGILDRERGGAFRVHPTGLTASHQRYIGESGVLVTQMASDEGRIEVTDALTLSRGADLNEDVSSARGELVRRVRGVAGRVRVEIALEPRGGSDTVRRGGGVAVVCPAVGGLELHLHASRELDGLVSSVTLEEGDQVDLVVRWGTTSGRHVASDVDEVIDETVDAWERWIRNLRYAGPRTSLVRRSAITLKLLDHFRNGAIVAAPTSSLPEAIGGVRNWDYRYAWIRDCAFSVYALRRIGLEKEAWAFLAWALDAAERHGGPKVMYDIDGGVCPDEIEDPELEGYRRSPPVRWGNGAASQTQNDVYGEILDCAYQWAAGGGEIDAHLWTKLRRLIETAAEIWEEPDHGIWEVRTTGRVFTYSAALCHVALDRGAKLAERFDLEGDVAGWRSTAGKIRTMILEEAWDEDRQTLTEHIGGGGLDASLLSLPLRRVIRADDPRMVLTCEAVARELDAGDGLLYRYLPDVSPDGLPGHEGAFLLCSFWLVDNLAHQGRLDDAMALYESLCDRANPLGLLPEQIDPSSGRFLGNFPQGFSHIGVIASGFNLARQEERQRT